MNQHSTLAEWQRAQASMGAAAACLRNRCYGDAVSRAYYAVFHSAKAALMHHSGINSGGHGTLRMLFGQHLVQAGLVEGSWGSEIGGLYELRRKADYDIQEIVTHVNARAVCQRAERFLARILRFLTGPIPFKALA